MGNHREDSLPTQYSDDFYRAFKDRRREPGPSLDIGKLTIQEAYRIQKQVIEHRILDGERPVGYKVGCTSKAIRAQFGLLEPVIGRIMAPHLFSDGARLRLDEFVDCAVEPEFVFRIGTDITQNFLSSREVVTAIDYISPGIEIHNYLFRYGTPTSQELIASNAIHAGLVVGSQRVNPRGLDLDLEGFGIYVDGELEASGIGAEIMGGPLISLRWLATKLLDQGEVLRQGDLVIPGSPVRLVSVARPGIVRSTLTHCGSVVADFC
jgi:2-keto-4-pentenoate hydratase